MTTPSNGQLAIDLHSVEKTYRGKIHALRGIEMQVHPGEIFGLLGPNGAGKSTLVKILMTVIRPNQCEGSVLGAPVGHRRTLARVGYLPEHLQFPDYLTARQAVAFCGALCKVPRRERTQRTEALLDQVGMRDWADKKIQSFSKGMKQRVGIAQALINDPQLVLLDEPTDGVDPVGRRDIRDLLDSMRQQGKTVFINSHLLSEVEMITDRVAILSQGLVVSQGTIDDLTKDTRRMEIRVRGSIGDLTSLRPTLDKAGAEVIEDEGGTMVRVATDDAAAIQPLIDALRDRDAVIESVRQVRQSLEDLFISVVGTDQPGAALDNSRGPAHADHSAAD